MKRIIFICRRFCPGEAWTNRLLAYAKGFAEHGAKVSLLFLITTNKRTSYIIDIPGVEIINLWENDGCIARLYRGLSYLKNKARIKDFIEDGDVCFLTCSSGFYINEIKQSRKNVKIVYEITEHPSILLGINHNDKIRKLNLRLKDVDCLFVISHSLKNYFISNGISSSKITIVNMFVDTNRFEKLTKEKSGNKYIAYCGVVSYDKDGVNILIKSFAEFCKKFNDYELHIYGRGIYNETIPKLKKYACSLGVEDKVCFTGPIPYNEIPQKLKNASILALARPNNRQSQNGFPTKLGEYLSTGNPVVVTNVGEIPLFIKDKVNGYLAESDNVDSFAQKLCEIAQNYDKASLIGKNGARLAYSEFSYLSQTDIALKKIEELF